MVWQHEKTRFGGFFIVEKPQSKHKHGVGKKCCRGVEHFTQPVYCLFIQYLCGVLTMKVEVTIDKHKKLPDGAILALEQELLRRLSQSYDDCKLTIRRTSNDGLSVLGGADCDKKRVEQILQETWESADDWFY
ncbi:hypothetical protein NUKP18_03920 [Klebsiella variicola]|nr:hypothetical protein NUKP18_03920 [Klebsiella variicola]